MAIYKLTNNKTQGAWSLPLRDVLADKDGKLKRMRRLVGHHSCWMEDQEGSELKEESIWFEDGVLHVNEGDENLIQILENHPWNGKKYKIVDTLRDAENELNEIKVLDQATEMFKNLNDEQIVGVAVVIKGVEALGWHLPQCVLSLRKYIQANPQLFIDKVSSKDYEIDYLVAVAFRNKIIETDYRRNAVVWADNKGEIRKIPSGSTALQSFADLLKTKSEKAEIVLQEINARLEQKMVEAD